VNSIVLPLVVVVRLTLLDAFRRRILWVLFFLTVIVVGLSGLGFERLVTLARAHGSSELTIQLGVSQMLIVVAFMFSFILAMTAAFIGAPAVSADIESGVLLAILARPLPNDRIAGYTALSGLRAGGGAIAVAVRSEELRPVAYRLVVSPAGGPPETRRFSVSPGAAWTRALRLPGPPLQTISVALYRASAPDAVYRQVTLRP